LSRETSSSGAFPCSTSTASTLRGPQGSLFGRNTPAGIINFETRKPTAEAEGYAAATVGDLGTLNFVS